MNDIINILWRVNAFGSRYMLYYSEKKEIIYIVVTVF